VVSRNKMFIYTLHYSIYILFFFLLTKLNERIYSNTNLNLNPYPYYF